jgi:hypothetical protein
MKNGEELVVRHDGEYVSTFDIDAAAGQGDAFRLVEQHGLQHKISRDSLREIFNEAANRNEKWCIGKRWFWFCHQGECYAVEERQRQAERERKQALRKKAKEDEKCCVVMFLARVSDPRACMSRITHLSFWTTQARFSAYRLPP